MVQLCDTLDAATTARICTDGCLVAEVRAARIGIQQYSGREVDPDGSLGLRDKAVVNVYRPETEVFSRDSLASFAAAPVTIDHPAQAVDASNWRKLGVGEINGDVIRDGEFVRVPIIVRDAAAVAKVNTTHKQLSMGYTCTLDATPGTAPDGTAYDAVQRNIRINHIAAVPAARGGPELKISDERKPLHSEKPMKKIVLDGLQVDLSDADAVAAAFTKLQDQAKDIQSRLDDANKTISTLNGEKAALEKKVSDAEAKAQPAALDKLVADRAALVTKAKAIKADLVTDGKTDADIRKEVVSAALGDAAKDLDDAGIAGAFLMLAKDAKVETHTAPSGAPVSFGDAAADYAKARDARRQALSDAWKAPSTAAA